MIDRLTITHGILHLLDPCVTKIYIFAYCEQMVTHWQTSQMTDGWLHVCSLRQLTYSKCEIFKYKNTPYQCLQFKRPDCYNHLRQELLMLTASDWRVQGLHLKTLMENQLSICDPSPFKYPTRHSRCSMIQGWLTDWQRQKSIDWLNKTHFSIPDRGLMARTVFWVLCSRSMSSVSFSSSPHRLQPTAEQMYRSWRKQSSNKKVILIS